MNGFQAILLGIVQGLTEFLPISSSGHLILVPWIGDFTYLQDHERFNKTFDVALHLGTLIAVLAYFARDWVRLTKAGLASIAERRIGADPDRKMAWFLIIGTIPAGVVGLLAEKKIEQLFHQPDAPHQGSAMIAMAVIIAVLGALLFMAERLAKHVRTMDQLCLRDIILIGLAQALAVFPGVSRSGSTITAGLALGLKREAAARFSFLLGAPIIAGAGLKSGWDLYQRAQAGAALAQTDAVLFAAGFLAAAVSGYLCIRWLIGYLQENSTYIFVYYRWALAAVIVIVAVVRG